MVPQITILGIALIGAYTNGLIGFFTAGVIGFFAVLAFGKILRVFEGGLLPRKARDETVIDFIQTCPELVTAAYPDSTMYQAKEHVAALLEQMATKAMINNPSGNLNHALNPTVFLPSALQVAEEQTSASTQLLAIELVSFIRVHRNWYGHVGTL